MDAKAIAKKAISLTAAASGAVAGSLLLGGKKSNKAQRVIGGVSLATSAAVAGVEIVPPVLKKLKKKKLELKPAESSETATV